MKKLYIIVLILFIGLFFPTSVIATEYYVSTTGLDTNSGTGLEVPLRTISNAISKVTAGDTIYVRDGAYPSFTINKSGTSNNPITISRYQNENPIINGGIGIRLNNVNYVKIHGFEVTNAGGNGVKRMGGIVILGGGNNTIEYCNVHNNTIDSPNGIKIDGFSSNNHINHNIVHSNGGPDGGVGIRLFNSLTTKSVNNEIGWNTIYNNVAAGGNADGIGMAGNVGSTNIHDNIVYGNGDDGIDTWNTQNNTVANNVSYDHILGDGNGFKLGGFTSENNGTVNYFGGDNIITGNTAYGNKYNGFSSNGSGANYYENNVAYNNGNSSVSNAWGFEDSWRTNDDYRPSSLINNNSYQNKTANYAKGIYTIVFIGNTEVAPSKPGDANGDNKVDGIDYIVWLNHYGQSVTGATSGDFNNNGIVDGVDYMIWLNNYGN